MLWLQRIVARRQRNRAAPTKEVDVPDDVPEANRARVLVTGLVDNRIDVRVQIASLTLLVVPEVCKTKPHKNLSAK